MTFKDWLMDKFVEWERTQKRRQSFSAFARYLDVKQASLSQWLNGSYTPTGENLVKVADKLGTEVYRVVGLPAPDLDNVPPRARAAYSAASERVKLLGIPADSPEAEQIFIEEFSKVGYKLTARVEEQQSTKESAK